MKMSLFSAATISVCLCMTSPALATVGCSVSSEETASESVSLYSAPDDTSHVIREIPLDDLVVYPDTDLAPAQASGWVWVRHDLTQEAIWQSGIYGWMMVENILDCG